MNRKTMSKQGTREVESFRSFLSDMLSTLKLPESYSFQGSSRIFYLRRQLDLGYIDAFFRFDGKTLYAGKELWKETLPLKSGSRVYKLEGLKSNSWYEVKISYPASIPALFKLQLLKNGVRGLKLNHMRRLLNTEKVIFKTESLEEAQHKDGLYVLVTVEPEGIVAIPNFKERPFVIYNIVCAEQLLGIPYSSWSVVVLVVLCLVAALILPRFLPSYLLIKDGDRDR